MCTLAFTILFTGILPTNNIVYADAATEEADESSDDASLIEGILTKAILLVGAGLYVIVCLVIKEPFTIESVLFNQFSNI